MAVDTEDLINSAIDARAERDAQRQQIAQRREQIARQLSGVSGGRRNKGKIASLQAELANLGAAERNLHHQDTVDQANVALRANTAFRNAHLAQNTAKLNRDADVATAAANLQNGLARLQQKYPNRILDSNQAAAFHKELSDLRDANPLGLRNESTAAMLRQASEFHDKERDRVVNRLQGSLFKQTNLSPEQFVSGLDSARATNVPLKNPDGTIPTKDQIEKGRADNGQTVAMEVNGVTKLFDRGFFDNLKNTFGNQPAPQAVTASEPQSDIVWTPQGIMSTAPPGAWWIPANSYPRLPNTPEVSYTGIGHAPLEGSIPVNGGIQTPSGGFAISQPIQSMPNGPTTSGGYASRVPLGSLNTSSPPASASPSDLINQPPSVPLVSAQPLQVSAPQPQISGQPTNLPTPTATPPTPVVTQVAAQPTPTAIPAVQQPTAQQSQIAAQPSVTQTPSTAPQIADTRYLNGVAHTFNTSTKRWEPRQ